MKYFHSFFSFDGTILTFIFPEQLKYADIKPIFKKDCQDHKRK